jgi:hypothetical protein
MMRGQKIAPEKMKKGKSRGKKRCVVWEPLFESGDFRLSRKNPIFEKDIEKVENVKGVDSVWTVGKYTIAVDVAPLYYEKTVIKRVKKVLGCG